jgi:hypothetical protein
MGELTMTTPNHPEGRLLAVQQQMFFAGLLAEQMDIDTEIVLRKIALAGLCLAMDIDEIAFDAAAVLPNLNKYKAAARLKVVPE